MKPWQASPKTGTQGYHTNPALADLWRNGMKAIVCGGRDFMKRDFIFHELDVLRSTKGLDAVIHGGAPGADSIAGMWAESRGVTCVVYQADWGKYGRAAGPVRNGMMLAEERPDACIAFPGGAGTADMIFKAKAAGVEVILVA